MLVVCLPLRAQSQMLITATGWHRYWWVALTRSQNSWSGQYFLCSPGPAPLQQGHPEQGAEAHGQAASGGLQGDPSAPGQPVPVLLVFRGNLLCSSLCPWPLVLALGTTGKGLALSPLHPPFRHLYTLMRSNQNLLFSALNSPNSVFSQERDSTSFIAMVLHQTFSSMSRCLLYCRVQNCTQHSKCGLTSAECRGSPPLTC